MTNIKAVDVSEIEKLAKYTWSDVGPFPSTRGDWVRIAEVLALLERSPSVSAPTIPEGYALVPLEPTEEMISAVLDAEHEWSNNYAPSRSDRVGVYKAMLSANQGSDKDE